MVSSKDIETANKRGNKRLREGSQAIAAHYDENTERVMVTLGRGVELSLTPSEIEGLKTATADDLREIEISPSGFGLHFPKLDADLFVPALLDGITGSKAWSAALMGQTGGKARTDAKAKASRENGKLGGRPKKRLC